VELVGAPAEALTRRVYNVAAVSPRADEIAQALARRYPGFRVEYDPDFRQEIVDSWPPALDDAPARRDWGWRHEYDLERMTDALIEEITGRTRGPAT